jgi:hypothetical protein
MTYKAVVLAADGGGRARVSTRTNDGDWSARESHESGHVLNNNAEPCKDLRR